MGGTADGAEETRPGEESVGVFVVLTGEKDDVVTVADDVLLSGAPVLLAGAHVPV
jgi:hypothetical protein